MISDLSIDDERKAVLTEWARHLGHIALSPGSIITFVDELDRLITEQGAELAVHCLGSALYACGQTKLDFTKQFSQGLLDLIKKRNG